MKTFGLNSSELTQYISKLLYTENLLGISDLPEDEYDIEAAYITGGLSQNIPLEVDAISKLINEAFIKFFELPFDLTYLRPIAIDILSHIDSSK